MPTLGTIKLFQTIGELYIVYLQSKKFLLEETLLENSTIMNRVKSDHDKLENIFEDLTRLQEYQEDLWSLVDLSNAYYRASARNLIFKKVQESDRGSALERTLLDVDYTTHQITDGKANYKQLLAESMQEQINRIQGSDTGNNFAHYDKNVIDSDWLAELSSELEKKDPQDDINWRFINSLDSVGIEKQNNITLKLSRNLNILIPEYIAIGKALFDKDNGKVIAGVNNYLENYGKLHEKIKAAYERGLNDENRDEGSINDSINDNEETKKKANDPTIYIVSAVIGLLIICGSAILMKQNAGDVNKNNDGDAFIQEDSDI